MGFLVLLVVLFCGVATGVWLLARKATPSRPRTCIHGYDDFGCQPACPLYDHCWGKSK